MRFIDYYKSLGKEEKIALAERVDSSVAYLSQLAHGHRRPGGRMTLALLRECAGQVTASPDSFGPPPPADQDKAA